MLTPLTFFLFGHTDLLSKGFQALEGVISLQKRFGKADAQRSNQKSEFIPWDASNHCGDLDFDSPFQHQAQLGSHTDTQHPSPKKNEQTKTISNHLLHI